MGMRAPEKRNPEACRTDGQKAELLRDIRLFVLDMDGTFYLGDRLLDGALEFLQRVKASGRRFLFFTNNSSCTPAVYRGKLAGMGAEVTEEEIMTSADVTIAYLQAHYPGQPVYLLGTKPLEDSFLQAGIRLTDEEPKLVVVGFDRTLTYEKLEKACRFIRQGAVFLATHPDLNCPIENGFLPDCGAICALLAKSTGIEPKYLGKPCVQTVEMVLRRTGARREETAFVGDRLYTDVAAGVQNGARGFLVLTGEASLQDAADSPVKPDGIFASLGEMARYL